MKTRFFAYVLAIATTLAFSPAVNLVNAASIVKGSSVTAPYEGTKVVALPTTQITGTGTNALGQVVNLAATFTPTSFVKQGSQLVAVGTLVGTLTNAATGAVQNVNQIVRIPVTSATGTCTILDLTLGPVDLNLLGLLVHLDQVVLTIEAQPGGGLLGDLLCAVANLLNGGAPLFALQGLLNQILGILAGL